MSGGDASRSGVRVLLADTFVGEAAAGRVIGTASQTGQPRGGRDVEGRIGMDNGALRMKPLERPGWGRESLAYGPFPRRAGLVAGVQVLNGHHASQTFYLPETPRQRARRWVASLRRGRSPVRPRHHENLAVGLFEAASPHDPLTQGHGLVVHASTMDNGELWAGVGGRALTAVRGLMNLPLVVVVVLREEGALYLAATVEGDHDLPALPRLRPLAIDPRRGDGDVHLGVHQRILGEVGYRVDTRVYRVEVADVEAWSDWCTTAAVADRFGGSGPLDGRLAERGGVWRGVEGDLLTGPGGLSGEGRAQLGTGTDLGLVHLLLTPGSRRSRLRLTLQPASGPGDGGGPALVLDLAVDRARLLRGQGETEQVLQERTGRVLRRGRAQSVQVLSSRHEVTVHVDGREVLGHRYALPAEDGVERTVVGLGLHGGATVRDLEAHPRAVDAPVLAQPAWPQLPEAGSVLVDETFDGAPGPLEGRALPGTAAVWERLEGDGTFDVVGTGAGAVVRASPEAPNPGRTLYGFDWPDDGFVDVSLTMTPPGTERGQRHNCRAGFVLWQDARTYLVINVWLDDWLQGTSVSTFYRVDGHEDMHDAVWTLTGHSVLWGKQFTLRARFDGERFTAYVDGRPVLHRAIRDVYPEAPALRVRKLALIANEEWGDDTGTVFDRLVAAGRGSS